MTQELTASQRKWYDLAAKHADVFAERAAEYDLKGEFPFENYAEMKESGYTAMADSGGMQRRRGRPAGHLHRPEPAGPGAAELRPWP